MLRSDIRPLLIIISSIYLQPFHYFFLTLVFKQIYELMLQFFGDNNVMVREICKKFEVTILFVSWCGRPQPGGGMHPLSPEGEYSGVS